MKKIIMILSCLLILAGCAGGDADYADFTSVVSKKEDTEETAKPEETEDPAANNGEIDSEPEVKRIDLTDAMTDVNEMRILLPAAESNEAGMHDHWYQDANNVCGYGTFDGNDLVDDFWITSADYKVYGIYVSEPTEEAGTYLTESGWAQSSDDQNSFTKDELNLRLTDNNGVVDQILIYRSRPMWQEQQSSQSAAANTAEATDDDYFFPNSLDELLSESQLYGMSAKELTLARNEVYARYGYTFQRQDLQEYFNTKSWYHAKPEVNKDTIGNYVSAIGMKNMVMIREYQKATGLTY